MQGFADEFGANNDVRVVVQQVPNIRANLQQAAPSGQGPDIVIGAHDWVGELSVNGVIAPVDLGGREEEFLDVAVDGFTVNNQVFGLPVAVEAIALFRNTDLVPEAPATWEEVEETALRLQEEGAVDQGLVIAAEPEALPYFNQPFLTAYGGYVFGHSGGGYDTSDVGLDSPGALEAAAAVREWVSEGLINPNITGDLMQEFFGRGQAAFAISGPWSLIQGGRGFEETGVPFDVTPIPPLTAYLAFTNYGTGNLLTKDQAIEQIEVQSLVTPPDAARYEAVPLATEGGDVALLLTDAEGSQFLGTGDGLQPVPDGELGDYRELSVRESLELTEELHDLRVPVEEGAIQLSTLRTATTRVPLLVYDDGEDTVTNEQTGVVYRPVEGTFTSEDGAIVTPGWREVIGVDNFLRAFTSPAVRGPFFRVFVWTYVFALLSVLTTFALGLALAVAFNDDRMRSRRFYRLLFVVPYALPSFLTALIWGGMLNQEFGAVNQLFNTNLPWLTDPWLVRFSILLVNLWLGFPYMFLITTGALTGIPGGLLEAARVDGATGLQAFRRVTFPLLLISVAPLLIGSFAFNFNNFNIIYLLTRGNPPIEGAQTPAGHSDILISYTYRLAFEGQGGADYGFAAAISVLIFVMVAAISAYSFRYTRALEEVT